MKSKKRDPMLPGDRLSMVDGKLVKADVKDLARRYWFETTYPFWMWECRIEEIEDEIGLHIVRMEQQHGYVFVEVSVSEGPKEPLLFTLLGDYHKPIYLGRDTTRSVYIPSDYKGIALAGCDGLVSAILLQSGGTVKFGLQNGFGDTTVITEDDVKDPDILQDGRNLIVLANDDSHSHEFEVLCSRMDYGVCAAGVSEETSMIVCGSPAAAEMTHYHYGKINGRFPAYLGCTFARLK